MRSHVHSGKDENSKQTLNIQFFPSHERRQLSPNHRSGQLSSSYEREQLETATKKSETRAQKTTHIPKRKQQTFENTQKGMSTENNIGVQTRAMAQWVDNKANPEQGQRRTDQAAAPTIELHRTKEDTIKEFVRQHGTINLDWYVPDLCNTRVGELIEKRLQIETTEGRILFSSPALNEFFKTSNFELNLQTGEVFTYLKPLENIGIKCQTEPFDIESLRDTLQGKNNTGPMQEERLERIPSIKKLAGPADIMPVEEAEYKVCQYCHLWTMYADSSVELKKKSELSQESAVAACKMYVPYISNIECQIEEVVKIFAMEKELSQQYTNQKHQHKIRPTRGTLQYKPCSSHLHNYIRQRQTVRTTRK